MAIRTLNRETDPPEGHLPSPTPQAWNPAIQDYQDITGQDLGNGRFGADGVQWGKTSSGIYLPIRVTNEGVQKVQQSGNIMEIYGATVDQRPDPTTVPVGAGYMAVNTGDVWQSNGFEWVVLT